MWWRNYSLALFKKSKLIISLDQYSSLPASFPASFLEESYFSFCVLLPDQISLPGFLYFIRYWAVCVLYLFVNQIVTSKILKINYFSNQFIFYT